MFCDMVGYSSLMRRNGALALQLLDELRTTLGDAVLKQRGRVVKEVGDGFLAEFESASDAVYCGVELQQALGKRNESEPKEKQFRVRIGLHLGDVVHKEGDIFGDGVNIACRIQGIAKPGFVYLSQSVFDQIRNDPHIEAEEVGEEELKGQDEPIRIHRIAPQQQGARQTGHLGVLLKGKYVLVVTLGVAIMIGAVILFYQFAYRGPEVRPQETTDAAETSGKVAPNLEKEAQTTEKEVLPEAKKEPQQNEGRKTSTPSSRQDREVEAKEPLVAPESQETAGEKLTEGDGKPLLDWRDKKNWRTYLKVGLTKDEVRRFFGEPSKIYVSGTGESWSYREDRTYGRLTFFNDESPRGRLYSWSEPD